MLYKLVLENKVDVVTFTSSSTVTNLIALMDGDLSHLNGMTLACIGLVTADTARAAGLKVDVVASEFTISGLVDALVGYFSTVKGE